MKTELGPTWNVRNKILRSLPKERWIGFKVKRDLSVISQVGTWSKSFKSNNYGEVILSAEEDLIIYSAGSNTVSMGGGQYDAKKNWWFVLARFKQG